MEYVGLMLTTIWLFLKRAQQISIIISLYLCHKWASRNWFILPHFIVLNGHFWIGLYMYIALINTIENLKTKTSLTLTIFCVTLPITYYLLSVLNPRLAGKGLFYPGRVSGLHAENPWGQCVQHVSDHLTVFFVLQGFIASIYNNWHIH